MGDEADARRLLHAAAFVRGVPTCSYGLMINFLGSRLRLSKVSLD